MRSPALQRTLWIVAFLVLAAALGVGAVELWRIRSANGLAQLTEKVTGTATVGGPYSLIDQEGNRVTERSFPGLYRLIVFGFTSCPDVCPTELQNISDTLDLLGSDVNKIQPLFITVDPERDTPAVMKDFISHFHPRIRGLSGTPEEVAAAAKAFRVYYQKVPTNEPNFYMMDHSTVIYFMDPGGQFLVHFNATTTPKDMADTIHRYMQKGSAS
ncbi:MAG: SCO family protein [Alphaproteobacteria bacterium]